MTKYGPNWLNRYVPPVKINWQGRSDGTADSSRFHEVVNCINLTDECPVVIGAKHITFLGFECDEGIRRNEGRIGAAQGPLAIRHALATLPFHAKRKTLFSDVGDICCVDENLEESQHAIAKVVTTLVSNGIHPIVIGGGHELAWAHYMGLAKAYPRLNCGIINFDAHYDLRPLLNGTLGTSGSSFLQIAEDRKKHKLDFNYTCIGIQSSSNTTGLARQAEQLGTTVVTAESIHLHGCETVFGIIDELIDQNEYLFVSMCMDVFSGSVAPGVSAPQPLGLMPWEVLPLLKRLIGSGKIIGFNVAEVSPPLDHDNVTGRLAASIIAAYVDAFSYV